MMPDTIYKYLGVFFIFALFMGVASAQLTPGLDLSLSPSNPRPNQKVTVTLTSFSVDINRSTVSWYQNGTLAESSVGDNQFSFTLGAAGSTNTVRVVIQTLEGGSVEETLTIIPADVLLVWQANAYTPPFYRGKTLHTVESSLTIAAIPNIIVGGTPVSAKSLIFTWERDGVVLGSLSGVGRDTLELDGSILARPITIALTVETQSASVKARRIVLIPISQPVAHLYEHDPLLGILFDNSLLDNLRMRDEETTIESFPYFFSTRDRTSGLTHEWRVGGSRVETATDSSVTLRRGESSGKATFSVKVSNPFSILETASRNITIEFNN